MFLEAEGGHPRNLQRPTKGKGPCAGCHPCGALFSRIRGAHKQKYYIIHEHEAIGHATADVLCVCFFGVVIIPVMLLRINSNLILRFESTQRVPTAVAVADCGDRYQD